MLFFFSFSDGTTPTRENKLYKASIEGSLDQAKELLETGTYVDAADSYQRTALYWAGKSMLKYFLDENFCLHKLFQKLSKNVY